MIRTFLFFGFSPTDKFPFILLGCFPSITLVESRNVLTTIKITIKSCHMNMVTLSLVLSGRIELRNL